jgi:hypothetical protein
MRVYVDNDPLMVMAGLVPAIQAQAATTSVLDCRVKPGNDIGGWA